MSRLAATLAATLVVACGTPRRDGGDGPYAGSAACAGCHASQQAAWAPSLHAAALRAGGSAQARFDGVQRQFRSITVRPIDGGREPALETQDEAGRVRRLPLPLVLGRTQIEQFLTPTAGGRLQALPVGYDTVAGEWFDIFPEAPSTADWTHWTNGGMNANDRCLFCHTTGYRKGYRAATDTFDTRWAEAGVGCEACHGPGRAHVERRRRGEPEAAGAYGRLGMEACAPCHVRAVPIVPEYVPGVPFLDAFAPELLDAGAYHPDGSLADEAFEWTSFQSSVMAARGVVCTDCHDPHASTLRATGDALCLGCHAAALAEPAHTHHAPDGEGARCVGCHMPPVVFMERDVRRDHHIARPDPEGAASFGAPDACTRCHTRETPSWAAAWLRELYGPSAALFDRRRTATALQAGRVGDDSGLPGLLALLRSDEGPVLRASAARLLERWARTADIVEALRAAAQDADALVRAGAASGLAGAADATGRETLVRLTRDPVRLVRLEAAFALRSTDVGTLRPADRERVEHAFTEWLSAQDVLAENPDAVYNRGLFLAARGDTRGAERSYRDAIRLWPGALPARHNLALLLAATGRDADAEHEWRALLGQAPGSPVATFSLGLLYGRQERWPDAARQFEACLASDPRYPRARYNLAVAYERGGDRTRARATYVAATNDPAARADALRDLTRLATEEPAP